jgi:hypothetical protein
VRSLVVQPCSDRAFGFGRNGDQPFVEALINVLVNVSVNVLVEELIESVSRIDNQERT